MVVTVVVIANASGTGTGNEIVIEIMIAIVSGNGSATAIGTMMGTKKEKHSSHNHHHSLFDNEDDVEKFKEEVELELLESKEEETEEDILLRSRLRSPEKEVPAEKKDGQGEQNGINGQNGQNGHSEQNGQNGTISESHEANGFDTATLANSAIMVSPSTPAGFTPGPVESPGSWFLSENNFLFGDGPVVNPEVQPFVPDNLEETKDEEGYFRFVPGTLLGNGRYKLVGRLGKGQYSNVLRASDLSSQSPKYVAIKMLRHIDVMSEKDLKNVADQELAMLQLVNQKDPKDKYSCVRLLDTFEDKEHLCLVFESLDLNLRELMHQYGRNIGLNIDAVRVYGRRLALALYHLKKCNIIHADFKLDNVLVGEDRRVIKLADFGCASYATDNVATPLLVSRYYRPPEVILGIPYGFPMDLWSFGCTLYEIFTGRVCFPEDNNEMMKAFLDLKGLPPKKLLKKNGTSRQSF